MHQRKSSLGLGKFGVFNSKKRIDPHFDDAVVHRIAQMLNLESSVPGKMDTNDV